MRVFIRLFMFIASLLSSLVAAQTPADPSGHWEGIVQIPEHPMTIEVDLVASKSGSPTGTFGQPAQGIKALPLTAVSVQDRTVRFVVKGNDRGSSFAGVIAADGQVMSGEVTAGEYVIPFTLTRTGAARVTPAPISPAIGQELEGIWRGTIEADGNQIALEVRLANQPDGTSRGTIVSQTGTGVEIPVAIVQTGKDVTISVDAVGASISGALNAAGSQLTGSWSQQSSLLPLTLVKAKQ